MLEVEFFFVLTSDYPNGAQMWQMFMNSTLPSDFI